MDKHISRSDGVKSTGQTTMRWTNKRSNNHIISLSSDIHEGKVYDEHSVLTS